MGDTDFTIETERSSRGKVLCRILKRGRVMVYRDVISALEENEVFRIYLSNVLVGLLNPVAAAASFTWECVPVNSKSWLEVPFAFVVAECTALKRMACDRSTFDEHFKRADNKFVTSFPNLGGDAHLVAPLPVSFRKCYTHFGEFLREAPGEQKSNFWKHVAGCVRERLGSTTDDQQRPVWLSTNGLGVGWLHVRIDARPKYYTFVPFKRFPIDLVDIRMD